MWSSPHCLPTCCGQTRDLPRTKCTIRTIDDDGYPKQHEYLLRSERMEILCPARSSYGALRLRLLVAVGTQLDSLKPQSLRVSAGGALLRGLVVPLPGRIGAEEREDQPDNGDGERDQVQASHESPPPGNQHLTGGCRISAHRPAYRLFVAETDSEEDGTAHQCSFSEKGACSLPPG